MDLRNQLVKFKICDIYLPEFQKVLCEIHGNDLLKGRVLDLSDSGLTEEAFAVIAVDDIADMIIIPVDRILSVEDDQSVGIHE